ncbi:MAG: hypothetical protein R3C59_13230 [Planctomycetaceae bacterium]
MLLFWCSSTYLLIMAVLAAILISWLRWMLRRIVRIRRQPASATVRSALPFWLKPLFAVWSLLSILYLLELGFAMFVDTTDAFNATQVSARWFRRHVEPFRNSEGFRDRHASFPKQPGHSVTNVFMIGDSFTIGQGINEMNDRFSERTEVILNNRARPGDKTVTIYNLGEFGWEVSVMEGIVRAALAQGYRPDMIVYIYMLNDIEGYDPRTEASIKVIQQDRPSFFLWTDTYFFNWMHFLWRQHQASRTVDYFPHLADSYREAPWVGVQKSLLAMHAGCQQHDVELRMVFFPFLHNLGANYEFRHAHRQLADFCSDQNIRCLDLEPILTRRKDEGLTVSRYDNHPNERCHALVADAIADLLLDDLPLPATQNE